MLVSTKWTHSFFRLLIVVMTVATVTEEVKIIDRTKQQAALSQSGANQRNAQDQPTQRRPGRRPRRREIDEGFFKEYQKYDDINKFLDQLQENNPQILKIKDIGRSEQGNPIRRCEIGTRKGAEIEDRNKPSIFIDAGIHAREWIAPATALYIINQLVTNQSEKVRKAVENINWYIMPLVNPDGYKYSWIPGNRLWRKNRAGCATDEQECCGVDGNRNYPTEFGEKLRGFEDQPDGGAIWFTRTMGEVGIFHRGVELSLWLDTRLFCSEVYKGKHNLSEPETQAVNKVFQRQTKNNHRLKAYVSLHSYGQNILEPYGFDDKNSDVPDNRDDLSDVAQRMVEAIRKETQRIYRHGNSAQLTGAIGGASDDYAKKVWKVPYVYTMELRPSSHDPDHFGFRLPQGQIIDTGKETLAAMLVLADQVMRDDAAPEDRLLEQSGQSESSSNQDSNTN